MRGEVLYFDPERGIGFIGGTDGNRYHFDRSDLSGRAATEKGERVEFVTAGNRAHSVVSLDTRLDAEPGDAPDIVPRRQTIGTSVPTTGQAAVVSSPLSDQSLFGYFRTSISGNYANFRGRARRKEYWGFVLFFALTVIFVTVAGVVIDAALGNLDSEEPVFTSLFAVLVVLAMIVPALAVTVRRIHDIGLSGWFILLGLIPTFGNLIILVFAMIPSQKRENRWGPVPVGAA